MYTVVATIGTGFAVRMRFWPLLFYWDLTICQDVHFYGTIVRGTKTLKDIDLECAESMWEQALIYKMTEGSHLFQHTTEQFLSSWYCLFFIWEQVRTNALRPSHHRYLKIKRLWCMNSVVVKVQLKEQFFFFFGGGIFNCTLHRSKSLLKVWKCDRIFIFLPIRLCSTQAKSTSG